MDKVNTIDNPSKVALEQRLQLLIDAVTDYGIFVLDPEGHIVSWNTGAQRLKGYSREEILGHHFSIFYPPEAVASGWPQEELRRAAAQGRFEFVLNRVARQLALPAAVGLAVVADTQCHPRHGVAWGRGGWGCACLRGQHQPSSASMRWARVLRAPLDSATTSSISVRAPSVSPMALNSSASASLVATNESPQNATAANAATPGSQRDDPGAEVTRGV